MRANKPKKGKARTLPIPPPPVSNLEQKIRERAYELYETRGREHGHDLDDWLTAESELNARRTRASA